VEDGHKEEVDGASLEVEPIPVALIGDGVLAVTVVMAVGAALSIGLLVIEHVQLAPYCFIDRALISS
jgi:hypothetical protein